MNFQILNTEILLDFRTNYISVSNFVPKLFPRSRQMFNRKKQRKPEQVTSPYPLSETELHTESLMIQFCIYKSQKCLTYSELTILGLFKEPDNFFVDTCSLPFT